MNPPAGKPGCPLPTGIGELHVRIVPIELEDSVEFERVTSITKRASFIDCLWHYGGVRYWGLPRGRESKDLEQRGLLARNERPLAALQSNQQSRRNLGRLSRLPQLQENDDIKLPAVEVLQLCTNSFFIRPCLHPGRTGVTHLDQSPRHREQVPYNAKNVRRGP